MTRSQFGQGWVVAGAPAPERPEGPEGADPSGAAEVPVSPPLVPPSAEPVPDVLGAGVERGEPWLSGAGDWLMGAPQVSQ